MIPPLRETNSDGFDGQLTDMGRLHEAFTDMKLAFRMGEDVDYIRDKVTGRIPPNMKEEMTFYQIVIDSGIGRVGCGTYFYFDENGKFLVHACID